MSKFTDYIDGFADKTSTLVKDELKKLIISAKKDEPEFVRLQAEKAFGSNDTALLLNPSNSRDLKRGRYVSLRWRL